MDDKKGKPIDPLNWGLYLLWCWCVPVIVWSTVGPLAGGLFFGLMHAVAFVLDLELHIGGEEGVPEGQGCFCSVHEDGHIYWGQHFGDGWIYILDLENFRYAIPTAHRGQLLETAHFMPMRHADERGVFITDRQDRSVQMAGSTHTLRGDVPSCHMTMVKAGERHLMITHNSNRYFCRATGKFENIEDYDKNE